MSAEMLRRETQRMPWNISEETPRGVSEVIPGKKYKQISRENFPNYFQKLFQWE